MKFEWDENKSKINIEKHGVSFREASTVFSDDIDHSFGEERFLIIGKSYRKNIIYVCYCIRSENTIRIISARKADKEEREDYYAHYESI